MDLRKIDVAVLRTDVVDRKTNDWFILLVIQPIEDDGSLCGSNNDFLFDWFELPVDIRIGFSTKLDMKLFEIID